MTTPRDDIAGKETHTVHDPFLKKDVEVSSKLTDRLRGKYAKGPTMPDGEPEFGWSQFETPPIQHEAADNLEVKDTQLHALSARVKELEERVHYAEGTADLAMKHRDSAEQERDKYERLYHNETVERLRAEQERDEAYERAAKVAGSRWREWSSSYEKDGMGACLDIADAIRRLAGKQD